MKIRRAVFATFSWSHTQLLVNHLFLRFIRVIRGSIVFGRERGDDLFEARIAAERVPEGEQF
jgi:hypothetical protein